MTTPPLPPKKTKKKKNTHTKNTQGTDGVYGLIFFFQMFQGKKWKWACLVKNKSFFVLIKTELKYGLVET